MTTYPNASDIAAPQFLQADAEQLTDQTVTLLPDGVDRAQLVSQMVRPAERWQAYQNAIALFGFQQWLAERGIEIADTIEASSVYDRAIAGLLSGVCQLHIGSFHICLVPFGSLTDDYVAVPRAALELEDYIPHLFIGVEVQEELNRVTCWGCLHLDTLRDRIHAHPNQDPTVDPTLEADDNWTYPIPRQWFHPDPNTVLLYLRCLEASAICRTPILPAVQSNPATLQANLDILRSRFQTSPRPLWKLLPWTQAIALHQHPFLALALLHPAHPASRSPRPTNPVVNVGHWLQGQLDHLAQTLNWTLLPPLTPDWQGAGAFRQVRPALDQFEAILQNLSLQGIGVPPHARGGYIDLPINHQQVRLYAITWDSSTVQEPSEWTLLLALGAPPDQPLPPALALQIQDEHQVLDRQSLTPRTTNTVLFSAVRGSWDEQFWVTLEAAGGPSMVLPPFGFNPGDITEC